MELIVKIFMSVFFLIMTSLVGVGLISSSISTHEAICFKSDVIGEIENSNYNTTVIEECKAQAADQGYTLEVNPMSYDDNANYTMAEIIVHYTFNIPLIKYSSEHQTSGYAR